MIGMQNASLGAQIKMAQQDYNNSISAIQSASPPKTLASALSRVEGLNERLMQNIQALDSIANALGALRCGVKSSKVNPDSVGAVGRLNDVADAAHAHLADIDDLISGISRALG